jgi:hypothetical protein
MKTAKPLALVAALFAITASAQAPPRAASDPAREAVMILRAVNTAQAALLSQTRSYGSLAAVLGTAVFTERYGALTPIDSTSGDVLGHKLALVTSDGGKRYLASVTPGDACGPAAFTSEGGLIYSGRALGC